MNKPLTLNDEEALRLARQLASERGVSAEQLVLDLLRRERGLYFAPLPPITPEEIAETSKRWREALAQDRAKGLGSVPLDDRGLYDEHGLPI
jgi:hypothetical protein